MNVETEDKAYQLFAQILEEAGQLETKMNSIRSIIGDPPSLNKTTIKQRHAYLHSLAIYLSQQMEGYVTGTQKLCKLIMECREVLSEGEQS